MKLYELIFFLVLLSSSCQKHIKEEPYITPAESYVNAVYSINDVFFVLNNYYPEDILNPTSENGVNIQIAPLYPVDSFPKTITVDFGEGITGSDNIFRKGKINYRISAPWFQTDTIQTVHSKVSFENYFSDNNKIDGIFEFTANYTSDSMYYSLESKNGKIKHDNDSCSFDCLLNIKSPKVTSLRILNPFSWVSSNTHNFSGKDKENKIYSVILENKLMFNGTCEKGILTGGKVRIMPDDGTDFTVDFGNGSCDKTITISYDGLTFDVEF